MSLVSLPGAWKLKYGSATKQLARQLRSVSQRTEYPVCKVIPEHLKLRIW